MGLLDLLKEAYSDVAPIVAQGSLLFHYKIPGDADVKQLQAEADALTKAATTLKGYTNQLLKSGDASVKAQQDDLRNQAAQIQSAAQDAIKMLNAAITGIKAIQTKTAAGQDVSIDDTSQIGSLRTQADQLYQQSMNDISSAIANIRNFFSQTVVKPSQVTGADVARTVIGTAADATRTGATALTTFGQAAAQAATGVPGALVNTGKLLEYLPWIVGGVILIGGALYVANLPKPKSGFSFGD